MIVLLARHYVKGGPGYRRREIARGKTARRHQRWAQRGGNVSGEKSKSVVRHSNLRGERGG